MIIMIMMIICADAACRKTCATCAARCKPVTSHTLRVLKETKREGDHTHPQKQGPPTYYWCSC